MLLVRHPASPTTEVQEINVALWYREGRWHFRYLVEPASALVLPGARPTGRMDGLWQHTCFEAFVGLAGRAYLEFNFSPSSRWAAYRFDAPRQGMREEAAEVEVWLDFGEDWLGLEAAVHCTALESGQTVGLSAVIEETGHRKSYWSLRHPDGPPDFHDRACFGTTLPPIAAS